MHRGKFSEIEAERGMYYRVGTQPGRVDSQQRPSEAIEDVRHSQRYMTTGRKVDEMTYNSATWHGRPTQSRTETLTLVDRPHNAGVELA